jgi:hypothetical protein
MYLYRAIDSRGQTIDFLLLAKRDTAAAKLFFCKELMQPRTVNQQTAGLSGIRLWQLLDGSTNAGRLRNDGKDQEGASSEHRRSRHHGPSEVHRQPIRCRRLIGESRPTDPSQPKKSFATEPSRSSLAEFNWQSLTDLRHALPGPREGKPRRGRGEPFDEGMAAIEARLARIEVTGERLPPAILKLSYR